jgi:hypothetical protein
MVHVGVDSGLPDEVHWWRTDDLWVWSLEALVVYLRAVADPTGQPVAPVVRRIGAERHIVDAAR